MHLVLLTCGLPGPAYHGGAVTCWAIVKVMLARGHKVTVLSLFDVSDSNPYLESRDKMTKGLYDIGAEIEFVEHNYKKLLCNGKSTNIFSDVARKINSFLTPSMEKYFPWAKLTPLIKARLEKINPDAIFAYHFDALSAVFNTNIAPIMTGVGDLWHSPGYFRLKAKDIAIKKYLIDYPYYFIFHNISERLMLKMLRPCKKRGAFAAHYAEWMRNQRDFEDALYLRTPAHDPVGDRWYELKEEYKNKRENKKPKILMIGDIGTAAKLGLKLLISEVLPVLEKKFGPEGFEIHLVGGGNIDHEFKILHELPYVKIRGRIVPPDAEFLSSDILFVPTPVTLGIRVRIITGFSYGSCIVTHIANKTGIPEITHDGNALVSGTGVGLAEEIIRVLSDERLKRKLEKNARRTFEESFSEKTAAQNIVMEIEKLT